MYHKRDILMPWDLLSRERKMAIFLCRIVAVVVIYKERKLLIELALSELTLMGNTGSRSGAWI